MNSRYWLKNRFLICIEKFELEKQQILIKHYPFMETILITGANRGIGLALTKQFIASGNQVIATTRNPESSAELTELATSPLLTVYQLDVTDAESVTQLSDELRERPIDVLINNAGIMEDHQSINDMDYAAWARAFEVHTIAPFRLVTTFKNNLKQAKNPRVITISSQMGSLNRKSMGSYAYRSSKAAVNKVMQVLSMEFESDGIVVCPVHPGWVRTDMGGDQADLSVEESSAGLFKLINSMTMQQSGRFWTWDGEEHPW